MRRSSLSLILGILLVPAGILTSAIFVSGQRRARIPSGTEIKIRLDKQLDTGTAKPGDTFTGTLPEAVTRSDGRTLLFRGATVNGRVVDAVSSGRLKKPASITLELTSVSTQPLQIDGKSHLVRNAKLIGGGAAAGALIGALVGGKKGAAVGAGVGAGAGTAGAYMTGKKEIVLPAETELVFVAGTASTSSPAQTSSQQAVTSQRTETSRRNSRYSEPAAQTSSSEEERYSRRRRRTTYSTAPEFSTRDQRIIRDYYADNSGNLPPGLAKRHGHLPPGLERHLERDGTLPPGLQKRVEPFPDELEHRLSPLPSGYSRVILEGRALILDRHNKILDIFALVH